MLLACSQEYYPQKRFLCCLCLLLEVKKNGCFRFSQRFSRGWCIGNWGFSFRQPFVSEDLCRPLVIRQVHLKADWKSQPSDLLSFILNDIWMLLCIFVGIDNAWSISKDIRSLTYINEVGYEKKNHLIFFSDI